jgi:hypothetical protein
MAISAARWDRIVWTAIVAIVCIFVGLLLRLNAKDLATTQPSGVLNPQTLATYVDVSWLLWAVGAPLLAVSAFHWVGLDDSDRTSDF